MDIEAKQIFDKLAVLEGIANGIGVDVLQYGTNHVDWDAYRREVAKDILAGFAAKNGLNCNGNPMISAHAAVELADALIEELKKEEE